VAPQASVMAVDVDEQRLSRVYDNLKRLGMKAQVKQGDGRKPAEWCGETQFDRILLDAPALQPVLFVVIRISSGCAAIVILGTCPTAIRHSRRHLAASKPGGTLVYATCSVLPEENSQQIAAFLKRTPDARCTIRERLNARVSRTCRVLKRVMASFTLS
jgi:16S rRNA (cytosine967-C5)-methyltransferase